MHKLHYYLFLSYFSMPHSQHSYSDYFSYLFLTIRISLCHREVFDWRLNGFTPSNQLADDDGQQLHLAFTGNNRAVNASCLCPSSRLILIKPVHYQTNSVFHRDVSDTASGNDGKQLLGAKETMMSSSRSSKKEVTLPTRKNQKPTAKPTDAFMPPSLQDVQDFLLKYIYHTSLVVESKYKREMSLIRTQDRAGFRRIDPAEGMRLESDWMAMEMGWEVWREVWVGWFLALLTAMVGKRGAVEHVLNIEDRLEVETEMVKHPFSKSPLPRMKCTARVPVIDAYYVKASSLRGRFVTLSFRHFITIKMHTDVVRETSPLESGSDSDSWGPSEGTIRRVWKADQILFEGGWRKKEGVFSWFQINVVVPAVTFLILAAHALSSFLEPTTVPPLSFKDILICTFGPQAAVRINRVVEPVHPYFLRAMNLLSSAWRSQKNYRKRSAIAKWNAKKLEEARFRELLEKERLGNEDAIEAPGQEMDWAEFEGSRSWIPSDVTSPTTDNTPALQSGGRFTPLERVTKVPMRRVMFEGQKDVLPLRLVQSSRRSQIFLRRRYSAPVNDGMATSTEGASSMVRRHRPDASQLLASGQSSADESAMREAFYNSEVPQPPSETMQMSDSSQSSAVGTRHVPHVRPGSPSQMSAGPSPVSFFAEEFRFDGESPRDVYDSPSVTSPATSMKFQSPTMERDSVADDTVCYSSGNQETPKARRVMQEEVGLGFKGLQDNAEESSQDFGGDLQMKIETKLHNLFDRLAQEGQDATWHSSEEKVAPRNEMHLSRQVSNHCMQERGEDSKHRGIQMITAPGPSSAIIGLSSVSSSAFLSGEQAQNSSRPRKARNKRKGKKPAVQQV
ncbi:hypothetical protein BT69DRAFT_1321974 [Atractiella rhizophila]|nr:hypothetical protein BT69DRAFT_1321974 [Atractiella rhizophila]